MCFYNGKNIFALEIDNDDDYDYDSVINTKWYTNENTIHSIYFIESDNIIDNWYVSYGY